MPEQTEPRKADAVEPESTKPESVEPETVEPETVEVAPESTESEPAASVEPESTEVAPESTEVAPESTEVEPESVEPESAASVEPEPADAEPEQAAPAEAESEAKDEFDVAEATEDDATETEPAQSEADETETEPAQPEAGETETQEPAPEPAEPAPEPAESEPQPEVAAATVEPAGRPDARRKVMQVLTAKPGRAQIPVAILLGVLAFGVVVQGRTVSDSGDFAGARRGDLIQLLDSLDATRDRAETQLRDLQSKKRELQNSSTRTQVALQDARDEANTLAILSGTVGATGPGIEIRIDDPANQVGASTLLNVIEELRDAGAEAIEINNTARVVAQTYLADDTDGISVDGTVVSPPFVIDVIGHPHTLSEAVEFPGGVTEIVESLGGSVDVNERNTVNVTSLAVRREPQYAQPAD